MRKFFGTVLLAAAIMLTGRSTAQEAAPGGTLTLDLPTALEIALSDNPTIKSADMEIERFDYVRRETLGNHLPSLSAGGQYSFNIVKQEMARGMSFGADMSAAITGDLSVPLVVPAVYASLRLNRTQQALAVEQARSSRIELVNAVTKGFYQILLLERSYEVLKESERTIRETVDNTRAMFEAGLAAEYDLLTAEVQFSNLKPNIINTANSIAVSKQMLKMYLDIPESVEIALEGSLEEHRDAFFSIPDPAAALDGNSEIRQLDYQQTLVDQQIRLTNAARLPVLQAYGSLIFSGQDKTTNFGMGPDGGMGVVSTPKWWWQKPLTTGFQLSVPIFSGNRNTNKVKQLRNQSSQIGLQRDYLLRAKELEARTSVNKVITARETMFANEQTVNQAEKAYSIARTRFDAGAGTMLEVNQAQLTVTQSKLNYTQAVYDVLAAMADYDKVLGAEDHGTPAPAPRARRAESRTRELSRTQSAETPVVETPVVETPAVEIPAAEIAELPAAEPAPEVFSVEAPTVEITALPLPEVKTKETQAVETPAEVKLGRMEFAENREIADVREEISTEPRQETEAFVSEERVETPKSMVTFAIDTPEDEAGAGGERSYGTADSSGEAAAERAPRERVYAPGKSPEDKARLKYLRKRYR